MRKDDVEEVGFSSDGQFLFVKITTRDGLAPKDLNKDESLTYTFQNEDDSNLKSRTLGNWTFSDTDKLDKIKYVVGVEEGRSNKVLSAYHSSSYDLGEKKDGEKQRVRFQSNTTRAETFEQLGKEKLEAVIREVNFYGPYNTL